MMVRIRYIASTDFLNFLWRKTYFPLKVCGKQMCWASCQPLYREYTRVPRKHCFIYSRPPAESDRGELQKSFTILTTTCKEHFTSHKHWLGKCWTFFFLSVLLNAARICFLIYQKRINFLLGASYCIIPHMEILKDVDRETFGATKLFLHDQSTLEISHQEKIRTLLPGAVLLPADHTFWFG